jgi:hypothetical protein
MGKIKGPKVHELTVQDGSGHQYQKSKDKDKRKAHANPKKEGYSKTFNNAFGSKGRKGRNGGKYLTSIKDSIQNLHVCRNR